MISTLLIALLFVIFAVGAVADADSCQIILPANTQRILTGVHSATCIIRGSQSAVVMFMQHQRVLLLLFLTSMRLSLLKEVEVLVMLIDVGDGDCSWFVKIRSRLLLTSRRLDAGAGAI